MAVVGVGSFWLVTHSLATKSNPKAKNEFILMLTHSVKMFALDILHFGNKFFHGNQSVEFGKSAQRHGWSMS